jgi:hypothetical protein
MKPTIEVPLLIGTSTIPKTKTVSSNTSPIETYNIIYMSSLTSIFHPSLCIFLYLQQILISIFPYRVDLSQYNNIYPNILTKMNKKQPHDDIDILDKIVCIGESGVGKSNLISRFT